MLPGPSEEPSAQRRPMTTSPEEHRGTKAGGKADSRGKN